MLFWSEFFIQRGAIQFWDVVNIFFTFWTIPIECAQMLQIVYWIQRMYVDFTVNQDSFPMIDATVMAPLHVWLKVTIQLIVLTAPIIFGQMHLLLISENEIFYEIKLNKTWRNYKFAWNSWRDYAYFFRRFVPLPSLFMLMPYHKLCGKCLKHLLTLVKFFMCYYTCA